MESYEPKVFISCHQKDKGEEFHKELLNSLRVRGLDVVDDMRVMGYKDSIKDFIERIGRAACVILLLSDRYLRDHKCILQLVEIAKDEQFRERIFPIVLEDAKIYEPIKRIEYVKYWETQRTELANALRSLDPANLQGLRGDMDDFDRFRDRISGIISSLADMNALTPEMLQETNFEVLYVAIDQQLKIVQAEALSRDPEDGRLREWSGGPPYPGLFNFEIEDAPIFFGRWLETEAIIRRLENPDCRFLAVVGASGSGKSSLVKAGLLARLKEGNAGTLVDTQNWPIVAFKPGQDEDEPFKTLAKALERTLKEDRQTIKRKLEENARFLREALEKHLAKSPTTRRVVLFIDQFEELFTLVSAEDRSKFLEMLRDVTNSERVLTIVTMRSDFFRFCDESDILRNLINQNTNSTYTLGVPGPLEMYKMIVKPARAAGLLFEPGLDKKILEDTRHDAGALALMAFALKLLYDASGYSRLLTFESYNKFGGVQGAIGEHASETFADLPPEVQAALPKVFRELLTVDESGTATRKRARKEQVAQDDASKTLMERLIDKRLLVTSANDELVEVAHEALFGSWPELTDWITKVQEDLILLRQVHAAAAEWHKQKDDKIKPKFLWPDERLKLVYEMRKRLEPKWNKIEQEFIRPEAERLLEEIENPTIGHKRRSWIGERLSTIGDPRPGVGLVNGILPLRSEEGKVHTFDKLSRREIRFWGDKPEHEGLPDILWVWVKGGSMEYRGKTINIQPFFIAKYPITYKQSQSFIEAEDGFIDSRWWEGLTEDPYAHSRAFDERRKYNYIPTEPGEQTFKFDNHPRETVSWYEAFAFCRWLNARLGWAVISTELERKEGVDNSKGIRLPTEWEWHWLSRGGDLKYEYPWGKDWDNNKANTAESGLGRTTAVGMYISGAVKRGAMDMCGNVREWALTDSYFNSLGSGDQRPACGASWATKGNKGRGRARDDGFDYGSSSTQIFGRYNDVGFRLVMHPPSL